MPTAVPHIAGIRLALLLAARRVASSDSLEAEPLSYGISLEEAGVGLSQAHVGLWSGEGGSRGWEPAAVGAQTERKGAAAIRHIIMISSRTALHWE